MVSQLDALSSTATLGSFGLSSGSGSGLPLGLPAEFNLDAAAKAAFFRGLTPDQVKEFLAIGEVKTFQASDVLIRENDTDDSMYLVVKGTVDIIKKVPPVIPGGPERQTSLFKPTIPQMMAVFNVGDMNLVAGIGRSATVVAVDEAMALQITKPAFEALCLRDPVLGYHMMRNIANNIVSSLITTNGRVTKLTTALSIALAKRA